MPGLSAERLTEDRPCLETPRGTDLCINQDSSFLRQQKRDFISFSHFPDPAGDSVTPSAPAVPCWRRSSFPQSSWQELQHPHESFQGFCLQPQEPQSSAGVISCGCCWRAPSFGEQPHPKTIPALPREAQSNSQGNPLVEPRMKCYILNMSREITSGTSVKATESLRNEFLARNEPVRGGDLLHAVDLLFLAVSRGNAA